MIPIKVSETKKSSLAPSCLHLDENLLKPSKKKKDENERQNEKE